MTKVCTKCIKKPYVFLTFSKYNEKDVKIMRIISYFPIFTNYTKCIIINIRLVLFQEEQDMNSDFARIITLQRKERHISQKQAASDLGISQALLSHYEKGIRECGLNFLVKIADYYNVSCDYLLGRTPEPGGKHITIEDIPDDDGNNKLEMPSPEIINFNRRIVNNSISLLFSLAQKANSITLIKEVSTYLMLTVYKLFRIVYNANPHNDQKLFRIPKVVANDSANAIVSMSESNIKAASSGITLDGNDSVDNFDTLYLTTSTLQKDYAQYSSSLLDLIKRSEDKIARTRGKY